MNEMIELDYFLIESEDITLCQEIFDSTTKGRPVQLAPHFNLFYGGNH